MMHIHGGFKVKQNRLEWFLSNVLCVCVMYHAVLYMLRWFQCFRRWCLCAVSQSWLHRSTVFCLFVFCFLFITLSALAEHLGIEFMGMNRSFLLVLQIRRSRSLSLFPSTSAGFLLLMKGSNSHNKMIGDDIIIILYYINAPDFRWLLRATLQVSRVLGKKVDSCSKHVMCRGALDRKDVVNYSWRPLISPIQSRHVRLSHTHTHTHTQREAAKIL